MKKGIFTGTFDPYTIGHHDIAQRALTIFDELVIAVVGDNVHKSAMSPVGERVAAIQRIYSQEPRITVKPYDGLAVDFALQEQACAIVKGIRSVKDFEYEREMGDINRSLTGIETVLFLATPSLAHISSSMVRELQHFGRDVSAYLPEKS